MGSSTAIAHQEAISTDDESEREHAALEAVEAPAPRRRKLSRRKIDQLIIDHREHGRRLAWSFLTSWRIRMQQDEVISVVGAALCEAANRFDPSKGVAFKTFFFYHLRGMLLKEISRVIEEQKVLQLIPSTLVNESARGENQGYANWMLALVENNHPERIIEQKELSTACWQACAQLDSLEQEVLVRYFVFDEPLVTIAEELKYCRCHISRVKSRALAKVGRVLKEFVGKQRLEAGEEPEETIEVIAQPSHRDAARRKEYTGGRGRRKQGRTRVKGTAVEKLLKNGTTA